MIKSTPILQNIYLKFTREHGYRLMLIISKWPDIGQLTTQADLLVYEYFLLVIDQLFGHFVISAIGW